MSDDAWPACRVPAVAHPLMLGQLAVPPRASSPADAQLACRAHPLMLGQLAVPPRSPANARPAQRATVLVGRYEWQQKLGYMRELNTPITAVRTGKFPREFLHCGSDRSCDMVAGNQTGGSKI
jgi:hypothetical protein